MAAPRLKPALDFLLPLQANNNKPWFQAHRAEYEAARQCFVAHDTRHRRADLRAIQIEHGRVVYRLGLRVAWMALAGQPGIAGQAGQHAVGFLPDAVEAPARRFEVVHRLVVLVAAAHALFLQALLALELAGDERGLEDSLQEVFGGGLSRIEQGWRQYLKKRKFREVPGAAPRKIRWAVDEKDSNQERAMEEMEDREAHNYSRLGELLQLRLTFIHLAFQ